MPGSGLVLSPPPLGVCAGLLFWHLGTLGWLCPESLLCFLSKVALLDPAGAVLVSPDWESNHLKQPLGVGCFTSGLC